MLDKISLRTAHRLLLAVVLMASLLLLKTESLLATPSVASSDFLYSYPVVGSPLNLAIEDPDHVWFTLPASDTVGRLVRQTSRAEPAAVPTEEYTIEYYTLPVGTEPYDLAFNNGLLWFTGRGTNVLGKIDSATGEISEFDLPTANSNPTGIAIATNGHIWFVTQNSHKVGRFEPEFETFTEFPFPDNYFVVPNPQAEKIAVEGSSQIWFTMPNADLVGNYRVNTDKFTVAGVGVNRQPTGIVLDNSGKPWVTLSNINFLGRFQEGTLTQWFWYRQNVPEMGLAGVDVVEKSERWNLWLTHTDAGHIGYTTVWKPSRPGFTYQQPLPHAAARPWDLEVDGN